MSKYNPNLRLFAIGYESDQRADSINDETLKDLLENEAFTENISLLDSFED